MKNKIRTVTLCKTLEKKDVDLGTWTKNKLENFHLLENLKPPRWCGVKRLATKIRSWNSFRVNH